MPSDHMDPQLLLESPLGDARPSRKRLSRACFNLIHSRNLIYNTCWEDPRIDRMALNLRADDTVLTITSAGCNVLDYALLGPRQIYAVDINYRQNALLELKLAAIKALEFDTFFNLFGDGHLPNYRSTYRHQLRALLSPMARSYWDRHIEYFSGSGWQRSFYFHGTSGVFARLFTMYVMYGAGARDTIEALCNVRSLDDQRNLYYTHVHPILWKASIRWLLRRDTTLSLLGVPRPQRDQIERSYAGGIFQFIKDCVEVVFTHFPLWDNYFWQVYLRGAYTPECCPEYLKRDNFERLKAGLAERIRLYTGSLTDFLVTQKPAISRVILLDHMDWLSSVDTAALQREWQALVDHALPGARVLWRSGGLHVHYVDPIQVTAGKRRYRVGELLTYHRELAAALHCQDRVHTYGSFYIADLQTA